MGLGQSERQTMTRSLPILALLLALWPHFAAAPTTEPPIAPAATITRSEAHALAMKYGSRIVARPLLLDALCWEESHGDARAKSTAGALGACQILVTTWDHYGCLGMMERAEDSYICAAFILAERLEACGSESRAVASYNMGTGTCPGVKGTHANRVMGAVYLLRFQRTKKRLEMPKGFL